MKPDTNDFVVAVEGLRKRFGDVQALAGVSFNVRRGELFGFLGPNGAGKTTTINLLTGLARADAGAVRIGGVDCTRNPRAAQRLIGVVPDESNLYPELSGLENLCFCAALYGLGKRERRSRARELLDTFGLGEAAGRKFSAYSKGMKRKLTIAAGIIHQPGILFLDEPTTGLDVASARQLRQLVADLHRGGTTVFLTTHYIEEAERLCDRVAFIVSGRIVKVAAVEELLRPLQGKYGLEISYGPTTAAARIRDKFAAAFPALDFGEPAPGMLRLESAEPINVGPLIRFLEDEGAEVAEARKTRLSLEDVFVSVTGVERDVMRKEKERPAGGV